MKNNLKGTLSDGFARMYCLSVVKSLFAAVLTTSIFFACMLPAVRAQTWDTSGPGINAGDGDGHEIFPPFVATTNAFYAVDGNAFGAPGIARWTECDGWISVGINENFQGGASAMTIHSNYLYVVGSLQIGETSTYIAKFNLDTGVWTALGDNFPAVNLNLLSYSNSVAYGPFPSTIAVDANNRIYVGFFARFTYDSAYTEVVDVLDVSTNDGASWQCVGNGITANTEPPNTGSSFAPQITVLYADGTNLYVGGEFTGGNGVTSSNFIMWDSSSWHGFNGTNGVGPQIGGYNGWLPIPNTVDAIATIGTNVYVSGAFNSPTAGLARFSSVTGASLSTGNPVENVLIPGLSPEDYTDVGGGLGLAVNQGALYFGTSYYDGGTYHLAKLSTPTAVTISGTDWTAIASVNESAQVVGIGCLAAATNGDCVFVGGLFGIDYFNETNQNFRLVTTNAPPAPTSAIADAWDAESQTATLTFFGTPGSSWQLYSSEDNLSWSYREDVTLWGGTGGFTDSSSSTPLYYQLSNSCSIGTICNGGAASVTIYSGAYYVVYNFTLNYEIYDQDNNLVTSGTVEPGGSASFSMSETPGAYYHMQYYDYPNYAYAGSVYWTATSDTLVFAYGGSWGDGLIATQTGLPLCP